MDKMLQFSLWSEISCPVVLANDLINERTVIDYLMRLPNEL